MMMKRYKLASVLSTATILAMLAAPIASAATTVSVTAVQAITNSTSATDYKDLGDVKVEVPVADIKDNDFFLLRLPADFKLNLSAANAETDIADAMVTKPDGTKEPLIQVVGGSDPWKDGASNHISVFKTNDNELKVVVKDASKGDQAGFDADTIIKVNLGSVYVPGNAGDSINATIEGKAGSAFTDTTLNLANKGTGTVSVSEDSTKTITENGTGTLDTIRFKEDRPAAFEAGDTSLKLRLPAGFEWTNAIYPITFIDGDNKVVTNMTATRSTDGAELDVNVPSSTNAASYFTINNASIDVKDSSVAKFGEVSMDVSGSSKTNVTSLVVANYASFSTNVSTQDPTNVLAGRAGKQDADHTEIGKLVFQENAPGSLREGGSLTLKLTGGAKWAVDQDGKLVAPPQLDASLSDLQGFEIDDTMGTKGWELVGSTGDTIRATIKSTSNGTKGSKLVFDKGLVDLAADAPTGDVHLLVDGTAGVSGDAGVVAKIIQPVSFSIPDTTPKHVQAGLQNQTISDIVVKENVAGAIDSKAANSYIRLTFQPGVTPNKPDASQLKVDGDLLIDPNGVTTDKDEQGCWYIQIPVRSYSTIPSTVTLSNEQVTLDRTVTEGDLSLSLMGTSLVQTAGMVTNDFVQSDDAGTMTVAKVIYPANGTVMNAATFQIGSTAYIVNNQNKVLDVAPFLDENGRSQLPVRAVSEALGAMVGWDPQDGTVTILKDGKAISITVGSYVMNVGGVFVQNDSPAINKDGRVFLPFRIIAEALGAKVDWDPATRTVYLN